MPDAPMEVVHIAGLDIQVGDVVRQRCAYCPAVLVDIDTARAAVPEGQDPTPARWPVGELVAVLRDGGTTASRLVAHEDGEALPDNACARLDPQHLNDLLAL